MSAAFRCHVYLVFAAIDQRGAEMIWESVEAAAEKLGCIVEGGSVVFGIAAIAIAAFHGPTWAWALCATLAVLILAVQA